MQRPLSDRAERVRGANARQPVVLAALPLTIVADTWRWRKRTIFSWQLLCLALAGAGLFLAQPYYTATAELLLETMRGDPERAGANESLVDTAVIESQLQLLTSHHVVKSVMDKLDLWDDPELTNEAAYSIPRLLVAVGVLKAAPRREETAREAALARFKKAMRVERSGRSFVAEISFRSVSPEKAATIVNAVARTYVDDQIETRARNALKATEWMEGRIADLRDRFAKAAQAVETFKRRDNIIIDANGKLASERELDELSAALARARAETSQARARVARLDEMERVVGAQRGPELPLAVVTDELTNAVIVQLRQRYEQTVRQEAEWSKRFGASHQAAARSRGELERLRKSIQSEVARIGAAQRSDLQIAEAREQSIEQRITEVFQENGASREGLAKLRQLEAEAQAYKSLHDAFLIRYTETLQRRSSPITGARVITEAGPPPSRSSPRVPLVLFLAACGGGLVGMGLAVRKEHDERLLRSPGQLQREVGVHPLGAIPMVPGRLLFPVRRHAPPLVLKDHMDVLRGAKIAIDEACSLQRSCVIGVFSGRAGEGKSTVAFNLAVLSAEGGARVLLVDANLRNPALARGLLRRAEGNLLALLQKRATLSDAVFQHDLGFDFLGTHSADYQVHPCVLLGSPEMRDLIAVARPDYDCIICDLPNALEHADVQAVAELIDAFLLVVEWGRTSADVVSRAVLRSELIATRLVGGIINKAPRRTITA